MTKLELSSVQDDLGPPAEFAFTRGDQAINRGGQAALVMIAAGALAMILLAFQPWVDFGLVEIDGIDSEALSGLSDGYIVAGLGGIILASAIAILSRPRWTLVLLPTIAVAAVAILVIAGYNAATSWHIAGIDGQGAFIDEGDPTFAPYAIAVIATAIAIVASVLAAVRASRTSAT